MKKFERAIFAGGCFWCTEAIFKMLKGVRSVIPGYTGGSAGLPQAPPTYEQVSSGKTGHAEVVKITYDPQLTTYHDLLTVFFASHDPTTRNRQGSDVGTQYRSAIFYTTQKQKQIAEDFIREINNSNKLNLPAASGAAQAGKPIVTEVVPLDVFYPAEDYHRDYFAKNPENSYCELIINPKLEKVQKEFIKLLKI
ncbi:MAG: peptide-methionine (S)-S-oxide reductase [Candidatus Taylorbacteria bacterium RIFCSPHIGHO2_02_49_25]|uniref:Peptide methionine sulfoxide reductase MsrA n=1 Tax=Candidatus Taylorbacteria bacterium RIFCSPHIGHO2_02_49_25 TaxID=1802305 RepID=A0A1G2MD57_9BACT|nr:MAG: Peptide methionine sulfoxide reductase MsrA [Parcubacteria group bacterium GW2011_GWF2_50_9]OHA19259.1 MAG: peptide-methionine (S)-S-oxide reductase [Candidatus Taylorbacteria bacterium RIFCSPHIGHO2_01_FULL_49_60]OHA21855.1 MAG: peptide-methionine (S)-S-oxide reductase [Candidatus Taylorbacteria bacterium RIFCSPHIGHO2_02_49_25]OHA35581.1 MAG: peptide-methionine (S)-S-oxide reductase [Candidatus Taylorbacteria bacterium RIFCSPLOWO2_02_50_13]OHA36870.1 MAG: peptide-methionine (S)-S-oxide 